MSRWFALMSSSFAISWAIVVLLAAPLAGILARRPLADRNRPRSVIYLGSAINLIVIGSITAAIDLWHNREALHALTLFLAARPLVVWSVSVLFVSIMVSLVVFMVRSKLERPPSAIVMSLLPQTPIERVMFLLLCVLIGVVEEFLFRGFAFFTIKGFVQSPQLAITVVTISFALQHGLQDTIGVVRAFVLGSVLAVPVLVTGSLLPSIIAHSVVDAFSGLYGRSVMEWLGHGQPLT
jgi:membrane protease YdiL (CAAX protease family)